MHSFLTALHEKDYYHAGHTVAVSLVHGGPAPRCLAPHLYSEIADDKRSEIALSDLPESEYKLAIIEVGIFVCLPVYSFEPCNSKDYES